LGMLAATLLAVSSSTAHADDKATREAEARFNEGLTRVKNKDYEAARLSFEQAYAVLHRPLILWNLALSEEKTGRPVDALVHFRQVARDAPSDADRANAKKHVDALLQEVARIDVQAPAGATVVLDGADALGTAPLAEPVDVMPGHHVVGATFASGTAKTSDVEAVAGLTAHVAFAADPAAPASAAATVVPAPAAATATPSSSDVQPILAAAPADTAQTPPSFWTPRTITATALVGVAAVAVGFGAYFGIESQSNKSTVEGYQRAYGNSGCVPVTPGAMVPAACGGAWSNAVNAQNRDADISNALYFAAGAFAVGAGVSWFFWPKPKHVASAWIAPEVGQGRAGLDVGGAF
jgi:hypothetical protein